VDSEPMDISGIVTFYSGLLFNITILPLLVLNKFYFLTTFYVILAVLMICQQATAGNYECYWNEYVELTKNIDITKEGSGSPENWREWDQKSD